MIKFAASLLVLLALFSVPALGQRQLTPGLDQDSEWYWQASCAHAALPMSVHQGRRARRSCVYHTIFAILLVWTLFPMQGKPSWPSRPPSPTLAGPRWPAGAPWVSHAKHGLAQSLFCPKRHSTSTAVIRGAHVLQGCTRLCAHSPAAPAGPLQATHAGPAPGRTSPATTNASWPCEN